MPEGKGKKEEKDVEMKDKKDKEGEKKEKEEKKEEIPKSPRQLLLEAIAQNLKTITAGVAAGDARVT